MYRQIPKLGGSLRVRILTTPKEQEIEGIRLDLFVPGKVCDVSSSLGAWLIANGYAITEMRRAQSPNDVKAVVHDRRRRLR
jgi:hypothetical protein